MRSGKNINYLLLYLPFLLALAFKSFPHASYWIAWLGSFFIFWLCFKGIIKKLPNDLPIFEQILRPIFFLHIVFAGYMACTSIFYYLNAIGYQYTTYIGAQNVLLGNIFEGIAQCQRYYVLGHAALVNGIMLGMKYPLEKKYQIETPSMSNLLLGTSVICLALSYLFSHLTALSQFSVQLNGLSFVAGTIALAFAIRENNRINLWISGILFMLNLIAALSSGFKEPIIICILLLGVFLLPVYGKKIIPFFSIILTFLFFVLPTFIGNFRSEVSAGADPIAARDQSIDQIINNEDLAVNLQENNWLFLTNRLSEIDMFTKYVGSTPAHVPFYKIDIIEGSIKTIIPRFFWITKPITEQVVMDRAYTAGVVDRESIVSAKPAYIVDCYLSYGAIGIWIGLFLYGYTAQRISAKAEKLFGGYFLGTAVIFAGLFQIFWRGNSFEFLVNSIFWSLITMYIIHFILKAKGFLEII